MHQALLCVLVASTAAAAASATAAATAGAASSAKLRQAAPPDAALAALKAGLEMLGGSYALFDAWQEGRMAAGRPAAASAAAASGPGAAGCDRPLPYPVTRSLRSAQNVSMKELANGAVQLNVTHAPISRVTPAMLVRMHACGRAQARARRRRCASSRPAVRGGGASLPPWSSCPAIMASCMMQLATVWTRVAPTLRVTPAPPRTWTHPPHAHAHHHPYRRRRPPPPHQVWVWENLARTVVDPRDGRSYPIYYLMHPWDHGHASFNTPDLVVAQLPLTAKSLAGATRLSTIEVPANNCTQQFNNSRTPIDCGPRDRAWRRLRKLRSGPSMACPPEPNADRIEAPVVALNGYVMMQVNASGTMHALPVTADVGTVELGRVSAQFIWNSHSSKLTIKHTYTIGITDSAGILNATVTADFNKLVVASVTSSLGGDWRKRLTYTALHLIQEVGFFPQWLPKTYKRNKA